MARDIIVIGASAGGIDALRRMVSQFPPTWKASVFVVVHLPPEMDSALPQILSRAGPLPATHPEEGEKIAPGLVYVAPPDRHMVLLDGRVHINRGPRQNRHRPSVDALFRSAAYSFGPRVIGTVLTGSLSDGAVGLRAVRSRGGVTVVQDPDDAEFPGMPRNALLSVTVDHCVPLVEIAPLLVELTADRQSPPEVPEASKELEMEIRQDQGDLATDLDRIGERSYFTCPECHGTLWEIPDGEMMRYRCRVGHAYSADGLFEHMDDTLEDSLWEAARTLMENAHFKERIAARLIENGKSEMGLRLRQQAQDTRRRAETIRKLVSGNDRPKS